MVCCWIFIRTCACDKKINNLIPVSYLSAKHFPIFQFEVILWLCFKFYKFQVIYAYKGYVYKETVSVKEYKNMGTAVIRILQEFNKV